MTNRKLAILSLWSILASVFLAFYVIFGSTKPATGIDIALNIVAAPIGLLAALGHVYLTITMLIDVWSRGSRSSILAKCLLTFAMLIFGGYAAALYYLSTHARRREETSLA